MDKMIRSFTANLTDRERQLIREFPDKFLKRLLKEITPSKRTPEEIDRLFEESNDGGEIYRIILKKRTPNGTFAPVDFYEWTCREGDQSNADGIFDALNHFADVYPEFQEVIDSGDAEDIGIVDDEWTGEDFALVIEPGLIP